MISPVRTRIVGREPVRHDVGQRSPGEHRRARHRQRAEAVDQALVEVLVEAERGDEAAERDVLHDDARDQEVGVAVAGRLDRTPEHVAEQQHEHDRLHGERDQQLGRARQAHEVALGDHERVAHQPSHAAHLIVVVGRFGRMAGQRKEHVVERGSAKRDVLHSDAGLVKPAHRLHDRASAPADADRHEVVGHGGRLVGHRRQRPHGDVGQERVVEAYLQPLAADAVLELVRASRARSRGPDRSPRSWSASRSASSRYCVVSRTVVPFGDETLDRLPELQPAARVKAGRRLVEEEHRRLRHQRGRQVEPAAHAARVGLRGPVGRVEQFEALEQLVAAPLGVAARLTVEAADHRRGSRARSGSHPRRHTGRRARSARAACAASRTTSSPATRAVPASGLSSVVRIG